MNLLHIASTTNEVTRLQNMSKASNYGLANLSQTLCVSLCTTISIRTVPVSRLHDVCTELIFPQCSRSATNQVADGSSNFSTFERAT